MLTKEASTLVHTSSWNIETDITLFRDFSVAHPELQIKSRSPTGIIEIQPTKYASA